MALLQPIFNIAQLLADKGVRQAIISPGSRNAPLTIALARHPHIETRSISDERSAAFIAMGMAQVSQQPVALCCTSGSAAYNYAPAVAEAFFQEIPLLVLTADRPTEWIHQHDGQTIYQQDIFGKHVKGSFQVGADYAHPDARWHIARVVNHAVNLATTPPFGPVHINIPLREPFYPTETETVVFEKSRVIERVVENRNLSTATWDLLLEELRGYDKVMIAVGQGRLDAALCKVLATLQENYGFVVVGDIIANVPGFISKQDIFVDGDLSESYAPDLLITFGQSFISKNFKNFLRKNKPTAHWHLQLGEHLIDTFQSLTKVLPVEASYFFEQLLDDLEYTSFKTGEDEPDMHYLSLWEHIDRKATIYLEQFDFSDWAWNELQAYKYLLNWLPSKGQLHVANSMAVRYANCIGLLAAQHGIAVFANRGTSGIDGCVSTAVGAALVSDEPVYLLVGDVAFFYDRNALWNIYLPANLHIVLMNNYGGNIFRMIDGPSKQPELETYFETKQTYTAQLTAQEAGMHYDAVRSLAELEEALVQWQSTAAKPRLIEIHTEASVNTAVFKAFKKGFSHLS